MTTTLPMLLILAHFTADFILQPKDIALNKASSYFTCFMHVSSYTVWITIFYVMSLDELTRSELTGEHVVWFFVAVFVPHYAIDRWSLTDKLLRFTGSRTLDGPVRSVLGSNLRGKHVMQPVEVDYRQLYDFVFTGIVYTVSDATLHLWCLYAAWEVLS